MKSISNTLIAAIIAVALTALVGGLLQTSFGRGIEAWTSDKMFVWRYDLLKKTALDRKPDPHLVFAAIDQQSVSDFGRWPFPRGVHGQFLGVLSTQKPKVVAWDVFFTEYTKANLTTPAPPSDAPAPASTDTNAAPAQAAPALPVPATPDATPTQSSSPAPPVGVSSPKAETSSPTPAATPNPAPETPATTATSASEATSDLQPDDEALVEGAQLVPHMVTEAVGDPKEGSTLKNEDILPTRPFKNVIGNVAGLLSASHAVIPIPELRKVSYFGFAEADASDLRRYMPMVININGNILPSFSLQTLMQYWDVDPDKVTVNIGHEITLPRPDGTAAHIPINSEGLFMVNYRARAEDFQAMSYSRMGKGLADLANNQTSDERSHLPPIKDNILVIGVALSGVDNGSIPIADYSPLVVANLNVMNNVLQQDYLHFLSPWIWMPLYGIFLFITGNLMLRVGIAPLIPMGLVALLLVAVTAFATLWFTNVLAPVLMPEFGVLVLASVIPTKRFFGEEREKRRVRRAMSAYLSEKVMMKVLAHPDGVKLGGTKQVISIMFCDIRGFTKYCDDRDPQEVLNVVNDYFEEMTQVVFKYDGTVDKYIGDCIMAFWNAPEPQPDHAQRAVCCAMEMRYALANFKTKRAGKDTELFECGIGIHTGEALVGNMGSTLKLNYTAMGSTVNLAARLEALTKRLNERILISEDTFKHLQGDFPVTDRGEATVPGFAKPIHVYAVGADQDITSALKVGRTIATQQEYTAEEVTAPIWEPAPLPKDADPEP